MKKYKIEFEEIDDPQYREISEWFNSFNVKIWEGNKLTLQMRVEGVNKVTFPVKHLIGTLHKMFQGNNNE